MVDSGVHDLKELVATGTCVIVEGTISPPPEHTEQAVEIKVVAPPFYLCLRVWAHLGWRFPLTPLLRGRSRSI